MVDLLKLLKSSDEPEKDQATLVKAQILFWLLGATDGHAKNFSLWLSPGRRFRLTPLYDIVSVQPVADAGQVPKKRMKLAMYVGDNRHYTVHTIAGRHFVETADRAQISRTIAEAVIAELVESASSKIDQVAESLPPGFPEEIVASVTAAVARRVKTLATTIAHPS